MQKSLQFTVFKQKPVNKLVCEWFTLVALKQMKWPWHRFWRPISLPICLQVGKTQGLGYVAASLFRGAPLAFRENVHWYAGFDKNETLVTTEKLSCSSICGKHSTPARSLQQLTMCCFSSKRNPSIPAMISTTRQISEGRFGLPTIHSWTHFIWQNPSSDTVYWCLWFTV